MDGSGGSRCGWKSKGAVTRSAWDTKLRRLPKGSICRLQPDFHRTLTLTFLTMPRVETVSSLTAAPDQLLGEASLELSICYT